MGIETVSLVIASFVSGSLGVAALMRNFRSRVCQYFALMAGLLSAHDALCIIERFQTVIPLASPRLHILSILLLGPASLLFLYEFIPSCRPLLKKGLWVTSIAATAMAVLSLGRLFESHSVQITLASHLVLVIPATFWIFALKQALSGSTLTREKIRLRYALWGGLITALFFVTDILRYLGIVAPPLGTMARVLYLIFLFQTLIQKELITADEVIAKISLFGGVAFILSVIYFLLVSWVGDRPDLFIFNTAIASFVVLILFDPIRKLTSRVTHKFLSRRNLDLERDLNELTSGLMGNLLEPAELFQKLGEAFKRFLEVPHSAFYLLDQEGLSYVSFGTATTALPAEIFPSNPLVEYMTVKRGRPFLLETIENDRDSFYHPQPRRFCQNGIDTLRKLSADLVIPFVHESKVVGFCAMKTGERVVLSNEQLRLFLPLSRQVAMLLKNLRIFSSLRDKDKLAAVGEMAAGLAHEVKNPLGAIKGAAQILKDEGHGRPEMVKEFLQIIISETDRLSNVLTEFLDYAKPRKVYLQTACDPLRVIEHTANFALRDSKVKFELHTENRELRANADPEVLKQILLNLFLNANQAMQGIPRTPCLRVSVREIRPRGLFPFSEALPRYKIWEGWDTEKSPPQRLFVEIEVADNGKGIPEEDRDRIFIPFFTTKAKGTGLGLAVCKRLVETMGGTISFRPAKPHGTIFSIHLPTKQESKETSEFRVASLIEEKV